MMLLAWIRRKIHPVEVKELVIEIEQETERLNGAVQKLDREVEIVKKTSSKSRSNLQQALDETLQMIGKRQ